MRWRVWGALAAAVLLLALVGAAFAVRGGSDEESPSATSGASGRGDSRSGGQRAGGSSASGEANALKSYRFTLTMELSGGVGVPGAGQLPPGQTPKLTFDIKGAVVAPDREHSVVKADLGFVKVDVETIQIGDRAWTREDQGAWAEQRGAAVGALGLELDPASLLAGAAGLDAQALARIKSGLSGLPSTTEQMNGVQTLKYTLSHEQFQKLFGSATQGLPLDGNLRSTSTLWVTRDTSIPVRMVVEATPEGRTGALKLELNLTELNSAAIKIEPPA